MFETIEEDTCPQCDNDVTVTYSFIDARRTQYRGLVYECPFCNYFTEANQKSILVIAKTSRDRALRKVSAFGGFVLELERLLPCPSDVAPHYRLPDGSEWIRQIIKRNGVFYSYEKGTFQEVLKKGVLGKQDNDR